MRPLRDWKLVGDEEVIKMPRDEPGGCLLFAYDLYGVFTVEIARFSKSEASRNARIKSPAEMVVGKLNENVPQAAHAIFSEHIDLAGYNSRLN